jgi:UDP-4-keto-D-FucNAc 4-reductase
MWDQELIYSTLPGCNHGLFKLAAIGISGSRGFIGSSLSDHLRSRGHRVVPLNRPESAVMPWSVPGGLDAVVHLAGLAHLRSDSPLATEQQFEAANVGATQALALSAREAGARRFLFMSSAGVWGNSTGIEGVCESSPPRPMTAYARSKLKAEKWLEGSLPDMEKVVLRPPLVYGPRAPGNMGRLVGALRAGIPLPLGKLAAPRSMISIRNLSHLVEHCLFHSAAAGLTMQAADSGTMEIREAVRALGLGMHVRPRLLPLPSAVLEAGLRVIGRSDDVARLLRPFVLRPQLARTLLGWTPPFESREEWEWMGRELATNS